MRTTQSGQATIARALAPDSARPIYPRPALGIAGDADSLGVIASGVQARMPSQSALASVLAEVTRQLLGRDPSAQFSYVLAFKDGLAIKRILKSFKLGLEMLHPRLKRLHSMLPIGVGRCGA